MRGKLGYSATEIKEDLDKVYGESTLTYGNVDKWASLFRAGRENIQGRPLFAEAVYIWAAPC